MKTGEKAKNIYIRLRNIKQLFAYITKIKRESNKIVTIMIELCNMNKYAVK